MDDLDLDDDVAAQKPKGFARRILRLVWYFLARAVLSLNVSVLLFAFLYYNHVPHQKHLIPFSLVYEPCDPQVTQQNPQIVRCTFPAANVSLEDFQTGKALLHDDMDYYMTVHLNIREVGSKDVGMFIVCLTFFNGGERGAGRDKLEECRSKLVEPDSSSMFDSWIGYATDKGKIWVVLEFDNVASTLKTFGGKHVQVTLKNSLVQVYSSQLEVKTAFRGIHYLFNLPTITAISGLSALAVFVAWLLFDLVRWVTNCLRGEESSTHEEIEYLLDGEDDQEERD